MSASIRVRFAPSPTGHLHIGGLRTALFNWLFARAMNGTFLVRIEDTDVERSLPVYVESIIKALSWAGLESDEPLVFQTQRMPLYHQAVETLLQQGKAYRCFCSTERPVGESSDIFYRYNGHCRTRAPQADDHTRAAAIRFAVPLNSQTVEFTDMIRGVISFDMTQFDDFIIVRSDGIPLYNFVVVVDDIAMRISHVIRGEDHIANTPKQIFLYHALKANVPHFAHLPLILGPSGQRLSKREAATSVWEYKSGGYLAQALSNYLMRLGWSYKDQEIFSKEEAIALFSLEAVGKSGAIFDSAKLDWINGVYMRQQSNQALYALISDGVDENFSALAAVLSVEKVEQLIGLYKERTATLRALADVVRRIVVPHQLPTPPFLDKNIVSALDVVLTGVQEWKHDTVKQSIEHVVADKKIKFATIAQLVRYALTGEAQGPSVIDLLCIIGKDESVVRMRALS